MTSCPHLQISEPQQGVLSIRLDKPARLNAVDGEMLAAIEAEITKVDGSDGRIRVVVITGTGRAFSTGSDLKWLQAHVLADLAAHQRYQDQMQRCYQRLERSRAVVIAAVNGLALAGGLELALACDIVIAAEEAELGDEHITKNFLPSGGASQRLPRKIGLARGLYHLLTGARLSGTRAAEIGLAAAAVPLAELDAHCLQLAGRIAKSDAYALAAMKDLVRRGMELPLDEALGFERWSQYRYRNESPAMLAGVENFATKS